MSKDVRRDTEAARDEGGPINGVAVAIVRENRDPSGLARVKVSFPWHSRPEESVLGAARDADDGKGLRDILSA